MLNYCDFVYKTIRRKTREVLIGNVGIGGNNPIRIQSMTTTSTRDVEATVDQIKRLKDSGCEMVRVTVQGIKEAESCQEIKNRLIQQDYDIPLCADIHFFPPAAMRVVDFVEKVRVNPGNFVDKRASFKVIEYTEASYLEEITKIEEKFAPLVLKCKSLKRAIRIGTNHGSLSDRIMNRYGDTPRGMVESALEFARVCRAYDFHDIVFSMKASNPKVMIEAYRLLVAEMNALGWDYPLHLGVTEAGEGDDGRIKSAMGIGALLLDGLGDTIRVSLTEDPWFEMDPCKRLIKLAQSYEGKGVEPFEDLSRLSHTRDKIIYPKDLSLHDKGSVILSVNQQELENSNFYKNCGIETQLGQPKLTKASVDLLMITPELQGNKKLENLKKLGVYSLIKDKFQDSICLVTPENFDQIQSEAPSLIILSPKEGGIHFVRKFFTFMQKNAWQVPVILHYYYNISPEDLIIHAGAEIGSLLSDGLGDGIWIEGPYELEKIRLVSFMILQAARMRQFKTEYISCPSCGRTLFNIQEVAKTIHEKTAHLAGVKIAIMGCIVNGPGEMADADFGYVGSKPGKIDLYVGKECVEKDIDSDKAADRLIELIKRRGMWKEKEEDESKV